MLRLILTLSTLVFFAQLELISIWATARYTVPGHHVAQDAFVDTHSEKASPGTSVSNWAYLNILGRLRISVVPEVASQRNLSLIHAGRVWCVNCSPTDERNASLNQRANAPTSTDNALSPRFDGEELTTISLHLSAKAIAGIVGGSVALIVLGIVFYLLSRDSRRRRQAMANADGPSASREECFDDVVLRKLGPQQRRTPNYTTFLCRRNERGSPCSLRDVRGSTIPWQHNETVYKYKPRGLIRISQPL